VQSASGDVAGALQNQRKALAISEDLAAEDPSNKVIRRRLFVSYTNLGDALLQEADYKGGLEVYQKALSVAQSLHRADRADPKNSQAANDLSLCYVKIGYTLHQTGNQDDALKNYRHSPAVRETLSTADPTNADFRRRLSAAYERIGDFFAEEGKVATALENQQHALEIDRSLAATDPDNADDQLGLALSYSNVGELLEMRRALNVARHDYQKSVNIMEALAAS
jgi:tetratricopeptide (TPR) repeat protein